MPRGSASSADRPLVLIEIPLHVAPYLNQYARMHWSKRHQLKNECMLRMLSQQSRFVRPLDKFAIVHSIRYSKNPPDPEASWMKIPLDCMKRRDNGLGIFEDDSSKYIRLVSEWKRASRQRVEIRVYAP